MNLLKSFVDEIYDLLIENNINEDIDLRISNLEDYDYQINNRNHFLEYLAFVEKNRKSEAVKRVREAFVKEAGYSVSDVRACEFILFSV